MEIFKAQGTDDTPEVVLDPNSGKFKITGKSFSEDVAGFFEPILDWLDLYAKHPNKKTEVELKLVYFNSASSKLLLDILLKLEEMVSAGFEVLVKWHYAEDDEDMQDAGEEYADIVEVPFEHISYELPMR
ncbi:MAG: hypothetical protein RIS47_401 [Bacteroidota bacterium]|jgi:hypothetical protein